jgi:predicted HTH transcriptional regulator
MPRLSPRQVFDDPHSAWAFLTQPNDDDFEGQHFDRKEAGRSVGGAGITKSALEGVKELVIKTVSAFANSNVEGGLLILGISSSGEVVGIDHLNEDQRNSITNLNTLLRIHAAEVKCHDCRDANGNEKTLCLIYSSNVPSAICETPEANPKAWVRNGHQSLLMTQEVRDQVRLRKGLLDLDVVAWCPYSPDDLDTDVIKEFRRVFHPEATGGFSDERLLREAGALVTHNGDVSFTLPGLLFLRYCQELCFEECGSGGVSELKDSVGEDLSLDEGEDEFG